MAKDPEQEKAEQLYREAAKVIQSGDRAGGAQLLRELLLHYGHTPMVKSRIADINAALGQLEK